jgi:hypothetical protein
MELRWAYGGRRAGLLAVVLALSLPGAVRAIGIQDVVDGGNTYAWVKVELPGTVCSDGSQYRFWYYDSPTSNNLVISFEGGGACWDYATCSGQAGVLGAAHPNGIPPDYITQFEPQYVSPIVNGADPGIAGPIRPKTDLITKGWDVVYMPYCTGDVHIGNAVVTYTDPTGQNPPIVFRHNGYNNTVAALNFLHGRFPSINKLLVTGFSAGGVASAAVFYQARRTLNPSKAYLLDDSGPAFPAPDATYNSYPLHQLIRTQWNLASVYAQLPASFDPNNLGSINSMVATQFPNDRMAYSAYSSDYNFSRFSYERFYPGITKDQVLAKWRQDQTNLIDLVKQYPNWSYHVPWERPINASHCVSIITFIGSHACPTVRKKQGLEWLIPPWTQSWICPSGNVPFDQFLSKWIGNDQRLRTIEPENYYNDEDPGMQIVAPLINDAIAGS